MRTDLDHLPERKRRELAWVVEIVREGFSEALSRRTQERYRRGAILKIILFGSYARGGWVEDPIGRYYSDYDILVVVNHEDLTQPSEIWGVTERRFLDALTEGSRLRTPVSLIVHSLDDVNAQLRLGRYFFTDIVRDGILLEGSEEPSFVSPEPLDASTALRETQAHFDEWFGSAIAFTRGCQFYVSEERPKEAAVSLHQAAERFYHCVLLVRSLYSPKTHALNRLRTLCEDLDARLVTVWPKESRFNRRAYELLRSAYVNARYSVEYRINAEELGWLMARVAVLREIVEVLCRERLDQLRAGL